MTVRMKDLVAHFDETISRLRRETHQILADTRSYFGKRESISAADLNYYSEEIAHLEKKLKDLDSWFKPDSGTDVNRHLPVFHWVATEWEEMDLISEKTTTQEILNAYFKRRTHRIPPENTMLLTLEIAPETQAQIESAAAFMETDVSSFIMRAAAEKAAITYQERVATRRVAVEAAFGCARGDGWSGADFAENKAADIEAENARDLI